MAVSLTLFIIMWEMCAGRYQINNVLHLVLVPVPTYVFGPSDGKHAQYYSEEGSEIVPNVVYMGKS